MEHTICSEIILHKPDGTIDAPMELLDEVYHMESCFGPVGDRISFGARYGLCPVHHRLEIVVEVPDGTPRRRGSR